jgi:hypothetical protein
MVINVSEEHTASIFKVETEDGSKMFFSNLGNLNRVSVSSSETKVTTDEATGQGRPGN